MQFVVGQECINRSSQVTGIYVTELQHKMLETLFTNHPCVVIVNFIFSLLLRDKLQRSQHSFHLVASKCYVSTIGMLGQWLWLSGRAVASDTRDLRFESSHWQTFIEHLFIVNCVEKTNENKEKRGQEWPI